MPLTDSQTTIQSRFKSLFEFLHAYNDLRSPVVRDISEQLATLWLDGLPQHAAVKLNEYVSVRKEVADEEDARVQHQENDVLLEVTRPIISQCPKPPEIISEWLIPGWTKIDRNAEVRTSRNSLKKDEETCIEKFEDDDERKSSFDKWVKIRDQWAENERPTWEAVKLFERVYELYGQMDREGERVELLLGDGLLECSDELDGKFRHPVLLRRIELEFCPEKKNPQFIFRRKDQPSELCTDFLRVLPNVDTQQLVRCIDELQKLDLDPIGQEDATGFLRRLVQGLFPNGGKFLEEDDQKSSEDVTIERRPVIFMRQRRAGLGSILQLILQDVANRLSTGEAFSVAMMQILGIDHEEKLLSSDETGVSVFGNEDEEILLSKPANQEQLQIAKQLTYRSTVLVQGPPGTGKTHTIANLIGHLLSQGKRVLVTAQTPKALRVLRREIVKDIQSLCVSVLQKEKQNVEELQQSVRDISVKLSQDQKRLEKETEQIRGERTKILNSLRDIRQQLFNARGDEIREIVFDGKAIRPIDAAKKVKEICTNNDWIPGPITLGVGIPITREEVVSLYQTNTTLSADDERELESKCLELNQLPAVSDFGKLVNELKLAEAEDATFGKDFWVENKESERFNEIESLLNSVSKAVDFFSDCAPWQLEVVQAGRDGESSKKGWISLVEFIERSWADIQSSHDLIMKYGPEVKDPRSVHDLLPIVDEMVIAVERGKTFGLITRITKPSWFQLLSNVVVNGRELDVKNKEHFLALQAFLRVVKSREELCVRWARQMSKGGAPSVEELGEKPEQVCRQYVARIQSSLNWHDSVWIPLESALNHHGFKWEDYLNATKPEVGENAQLLRLRTAILGDFIKIVTSRIWALRLRNLQKTKAFFNSQIPSETEKDGILTRRLRQAVLDGSHELYVQLHAELCRLKALVKDLSLRTKLLDKVAVSAPAWASAIRMRFGEHGRSQAPGDPCLAWEWRQLHDELERRASVSLEDLQERIELLNKQLLEVTSKLVDKQTWLKQINTVRPEEKRALNAYATLQSKKTKGGNGKKDEVIRVAARKEMETAKGAVPVWIMPLNEVVENFNPLNTRFDVVIIDEASQSDPLAMFALYLGKQTIVVGDDEQVTPTAPGIEAEEVMKLIRTYLDNVPHKEFYDGETSIYDFAKTTFGNVIRLVEHFRCAPDIIAFSNALSYNGDIKPLREESFISLRPNVVAHRVEGIIDDVKVNAVEAETVAALICAAIEQPEYKNKTFGAISLLGDRQFSKIEEILRAKLPPDIYQHREILCGTAAHFQGDQRDVIFLSMVDSPSDGPLNLRDADANRKLFKKRYNVAASRAKDQMWLVHSLNHETDLKPGDIRKRLIEHMLDPKAWQRELEQKLTKAESPFEERVMSHLMERSFKVQPQYQVGAYRIDMVVSGGGKRVAIECDGEQWHGTDKLQEDTERQAILERLGWRFIRIRGSIFFRDAERAMSTVFKRLGELGILPERETPVLPVSEHKSDLIERVRCRAQEIQSDWTAQRAETEVVEQSGVAL